MTVGLWYEGCFIPFRFSIGMLLALGRISGVWFWPSSRTTRRTMSISQRLPKKRFKSWPCFSALSTVLTLYFRMNEFTEWPEWHFLLSTKLKGNFLHLSLKIRWANTQHDKRQVLPFVGFNMFNRWMDESLKLPCSICMLSSLQRHP